MLHVAITEPQGLIYEVKYPIIKNFDLTVSDDSEYYLSSANLISTAPGHRLTVTRGL